MNTNAAQYANSAHAIPDAVIGQSMTMQDHHSAAMHDGSFEAESLPEHRLMVAMLRDSLRCIERYRKIASTRGRRLLEREAQWMLSDDTDELFSFAGICEALDLDAASVRRSVGLLR